MLMHVTRLTFTFFADVSQGQMLHEGNAVLDLHFLLNSLTQEAFCQAAECHCYDMYAASAQMSPMAYAAHLAMPA